MVFSNFLRNVNSVASCFDNELRLKTNPLQEGLQLAQIPLFFPVSARLALIQTDSLPELWPPTEAKSILLLLLFELIFPRGANLVFISPGRVCRGLSFPRHLNRGSIRQNAESQRPCSYMVSLPCASTGNALNMVFTPPAWVPKLPFDPPDSIPISEFMLSEKYGRHPLRKSRPPFTCGLTGAEYSAVEVCERVEQLATALSKELQWAPNEGTEWEKVAGIFSVNTVGGLAIARIIA